MPNLPKQCFLCGKDLRYNTANEAAVAQGLPTTPNTHDHDAKSEMHFGHVRDRGGRQEFSGLSTEFWHSLGINEPTDSIVTCYECHEVVMHNPVLNRSQLERLAKSFIGKGLAEKVKALNEILEAGLNHYDK